MFQVLSRTNPLFSRTLILYTLLANLCITCTQKNTIATHSYTRPGHGDQPCGLELMAGGMPKAVNNDMSDEGGHFGLPQPRPGFLD